MNIFHFSDLHFDGSSDRKKYMRECADAFNQCQEFNFSQEDLLVLSGDIVLRGKSEGYNVAKEFIAEIWLNKGRSPASVIVCPGNHDIINKNFRDFDGFVYSVRRDHAICFDNAEVANLVETSNAIILVLNSAFHLNHTYGTIDIKSLIAVLNAHTDKLNLSNKKKIVVIHHNFMGVHLDDASTLRTGFPLLALLVSHGFSLVLHGHQHANLQIYIDKDMRLHGTRSLYSLHTDYSNGMSTLTFKDQQWHSNNFSFKKDANIPTVLSLVKDA